MSARYEDLRRQLSRARTQEDVDKVVKAARSALDDEEFSSLMNKVLTRRRQLPERQS